MAARHTDILTPRTRNSFEAGARRAHRTVARTRENVRYLLKMVVRARAYQPVDSMEGLHAKGPMQKAALQGEYWLLPLRYVTAQSGPIEPWEASASHPAQTHQSSLTITHGRWEDAL